jgi:hypothetical protein
MSCKSCQSTNQKTFESEINIHFPELSKLKSLPVLAFSKLVICLDCGFMESTLTDTELRELIEGSDGIEKNRP